MGRDRTSSIERNGFLISIDKDHKGSYKGNQAMNEDYRGWHYHVESLKYSQEEIMKIIENYLIYFVKAEKFEPEELYIGVVEHEPEKVSCFRKGRKSVILWISGFNKKLHIEANKAYLYTQNLISKQDLIDLFENYTRYLRS